MKLNQSFLAALVAIAGIAAVGVLQLPQLNHLKNKSQNISPAGVAREIETERLRLSLIKKMPAFGFDNLLANWVLLGFIQYFGDDEARQISGYQLSPDYFEIIVDRDPRFRMAYLFLSTSLSLYAGMPERSVALVAKGLKSLSPQVPEKSYYIWRQKGIDELVFVGDRLAAKQSFTKASEWASIYSDEESQFIAAVSRTTAEFLQKNPKSKFAQFLAWQAVLANARDKRTWQTAISKIEQLGGKVVFTPEGKVEKIQPPPRD